MPSVKIVRYYSACSHLVIKKVDGMCVKLERKGLKERNVIGQNLLI